VDGFFEWMAIKGQKAKQPYVLMSWSLTIHDRMPLILAPSDYEEWLSDHPDPRELMRPFPASPMRMWPVSTRVNKPENDDPRIV
jgi:putative SOS response-associated peptidase YedK